MSRIADIFDSEIRPFMEERQKGWLAEARATARWYATKFGEVTIDNVRAYCPPPEDADPRLMGAVFRHKDFRLDRHEKSRRKKCHQRPVGVFKLVNSFHAAPAAGKPGGGDLQGSLAFPGAIPNGKDTL